MFACCTSIYIYIYIYTATTWMRQGMWVSHAPHVNESCPTCEWVMSHKWMCHVPHVKKARSSCQVWLPCFTCRLCLILWVNETCHTLSPHTSHTYCPNIANCGILSECVTARMKMHQPEVPRVNETLSSPQFVCGTIVQPVCVYVRAHVRVRVYAGVCVMCARAFACFVPLFPSLVYLWPSVSDGFELMHVQ